MKFKQTICMMLIAGGPSISWAADVTDVSLTKCSKRFGTIQTLMNDDEKFQRQQLSIDLDPQKGETEAQVRTALRQCTSKFRSEMADSSSSLSRSTKVGSQRLSMSATLLALIDADEKDSQDVRNSAAYFAVPTTADPAAR